MHLNSKVISCNTFIILLYKRLISLIGTLHPNSATLPEDQGSLTEIRDKDQDYVVMREPKSEVAGRQHL